MSCNRLRHIGYNENELKASKKQKKKTMLKKKKKNKTCDLNGEL